MSEFDEMLSGIIIVLLMFVVWTWYSKSKSCDDSNFKLSCGCRGRTCRCRGYMQTRRPGPARPTCGARRLKNMNRESEGYESNVNYGNDEKTAEEHVTERAPMNLGSSLIGGGYQESTKKMALEDAVGDSHQRWCSSLNFNGLATGASSCTTLEETGRSYGTADFVGLTARKFCKARQLATPADDVRVTPSQNITEWCGIDMNSII